MISLDVSKLEINNSSFIYPFVFCIFPSYLDCTNGFFPFVQQRMSKIIDHTTSYHIYDPCILAYILIMLRTH
jgi:hypothetical protein